MGKDIQQFAGIGVFLVVWSISLYCALKPQVAAKMSAKWFELSARIYGFEAVVKATPKAELICRVWNIVFLLVTAAIVGFFLFIKSMPGTCHLP